jgi:hypothetical protein
MTEQQQERIIAAYKDYFGTSTIEETVAAYKKMLTEMVRSQVIYFESRLLREQVEAEHRKNEEALAASFDIVQ